MYFQAQLYETSLSSLLLLQEMELRRAALAGARLEPGQRAWLARQQRAWRRGALLREQVLLLALAGADLDLFTAATWRRAAHETAAYLVGCEIQAVRSPRLCQYFGLLLAFTQNVRGRDEPEGQGCCIMAKV